MKYIIHILIINFLIFFKTSSFSQINNEKGNLINIKGSISLNTNIYSADGINQRKNPFSYGISGNPILNIKKINIPLNVTYQDRQFGFHASNPFSRFGISPTYKWAKLLVGWSNLNYSPYIMSGRSFFGFGLEIKPGKFYFSTFYGRFQNNFAFLDTALIGIIEIPNNRRIGYGFKIGVGGNKSSFGVSIIKAKDDNIFNYNKISFNELTPKENIAVGIDFKFPIFKGMTFFTNFGSSLYSSDNSSRKIIIEENYKFIERLNLFNPNLSTSITFAGDCGLNYRYKNTLIGVKYNRIDPDYQTLTGNFIQNDIENYTLTLNTRFFKKLFVNISSGYQHNNINKTIKFSNSRIINSFSFNYSIDKKWNVSGNFSNYQQSLNNGYKILLDSNRLVNISNNASFVLRYNSTKSRYPFNINLSLFGFTYDNKKFSDLILNNNQSYASTSLGTTINIKKNKFNLGANLLYNINVNNYEKTEQYGFSINLNKIFFNNQVMTNLNFTYLSKDYNNLRNGYIIRANHLISFKINDKNNIGIRSSLINHFAVLSKSFTEYQSSLNYNINF